MVVERIIEFFMENIIFLFIVIAGLISFFRRAGDRANQNEEQREAEPLPPVSKPFFQELFEVEAPVTEHEKNVISDKEVTTDQTVNEINDSAMEIFHYEDIPNKIELTRLQSNENRQSEKKRSSISNKRAFHHPTKQQVTDGVVWAEILGPPRAKKPYRLRSRIY